MLDIDVGQSYGRDLENVAFCRKVQDSLSVSLSGWTNIHRLLEFWDSRLLDSNHLTASFSAKVSGM